MSDASRRTASGRIAAALLVVLALATVFYQVVMDNLPKGDVRQVEGYTPWSKETLEAAATIPIQDGGRIKPLSTYAGFSMLSLHGARKMEISGKDGAVILKPTDWLLDALFRPKLAIQQPTFRVDNSAALEAIGVKPRDRRDRYSYNDIRPGREKLDALSRSYQQIDPKKRDPIQNQIVDLSTNVRSYEALLGHFTFARNGVPLPGSGAEGQPDKRADLSAVLATLPEIRRRVGQTKVDSPPPPAIAPLMEELAMLSEYARSGLAILPPHSPTEVKWRNAGTAVQEIVRGDCPDPDATISDLQTLETLARTAGHDEPAFRAAVIRLHDSLVERATKRAEYRHVEREYQYYRNNGFVHALAWYLLATLTALAMWMCGRSLAGTIFSWSTAVLTTVGLAYCCHAIVQRCIIMGRPPVGNLYDTIVFISATIVLISLVTESLVRRRFALGIAPVVGAGLVLLARRFELGDAKDHMDPLVAVLDSNFWLTTHVITIVLGYSAGLLASFLSAGYVLLRGLRLDAEDSPMRRSLTRTVYGMICFTLLLSLVGTVLGGIWANYSWGRFWGWDPKENGALLIVLWTLAILHARLGGFLREWGLHLASVFTAIIVTFSWWHVNFLGVGLHNYGFTAGKTTIWVFYAAMASVALFGCVCAVLESAAKSQNRSDP